MKVLVIGESCLDVFIVGSTSRRSPEGPHLILNPTSNKLNSGMAGNTYENIKALNNEWDINLVSQKTEIIKKRFVDEESNTILLRVDENDNARRIENIEALNISSYDAVVVSDYNKGFLTEPDLEYIGSNAKISFLDSKKQIDKWAENYSFIKINRKEFEYQKNKDYIKNLNLIVTLGKEGCKVFPSNKQFKYKEAELRDQAGLGDSFLAGFVSEYLTSKNIEEACKFANKVSYCAACRKGVSIISRADVLSLPD